MKALSSLPHGSADCECGFSDKKHLLEGRASFSIESVNGLRQVKTYLQRYDRDATKVPMSPELLGSVKKSRARYAERVEEGRDDTQGLQLVGTQREPDVGSEQQLNGKAAACCALLICAEALNVLKHLVQFSLQKHGEGSERPTAANGSEH